MRGQVAIGEFSTMTRLTRKALRHYHDLGLLEPTLVDPVNGYRYYSTGQVETARLIRRLRELELPVPDVKSYLAADDRARDEILAGHLARMQTQLRQTQDAVTALQSLLTPGREAPIEIRELPGTLAVAIATTVTLADVIDWWTVAGHELATTLRAAGVAATGPLTGDFDQALFADEVGAVRLWLPVDQAIAVGGRVQLVEIASGTFAVATHEGPDAEIDRTYSDLGRYVADRDIGLDGPVRERYLAGVLSESAELVTEINWPVQNR
jgi:DNA-binding transcriptional MerR regulator/effector-binding domain-containing protein